MHNDKLILDDGLGRSRIKKHLDGVKELESQLGCLYFIANAVN